MKKFSFVLIEVIFSVVLFSIIFIYTLNSTLSIQKQNQQSYKRNIAILKLESTKLFLEKNKNFTKLQFTENKLFYDTHLLLDSITSYTLSKESNLTNIDICLNDICQKWYFK
jgi:Tfp pilus assembly protein PilV